MARTEEKKELMPFRHERLPGVFGEMDKMFERFFERPLGRHWWPMFNWPEEMAMTYPTVDIFEDKDMVVVKAEMPGAKKENLSVEISDSSITLSGEKKIDEEVKEKDYFRHELSYGSFKRSFPLPAEVQGNKAKAKFTDGVLEIRIPKTEEAKRKEVKVTIE